MIVYVSSLFCIVLYFVEIMKISVEISLLTMLFLYNVAKQNLFCKQKRFCFATLYKNSIVNKAYFYTIFIISTK